MRLSVDKSLSPRSHNDNASLTPISSGVGRCVYLDAADLAALRAEVVRRAAELRPGRGALNVGLTPKWYRDRVAHLDALRARLRAAEEAAGVIA